MSALPDMKALRRQLLTNGYEPIPIRGKAPRWKGWSEGEITDARLTEIEAAHSDHVSTGIRTGLCAAIDIDLTDAAHVIEVETVIDATLGTTPLRRVGSKGALLCYRNEQPISKITIGLKDKRLIEILGSGQHFAAYGVHPDTGRAYEWPNDFFGGEPTQTPIADLPLVTPDQLFALARELCAKLKALGYGDVTVSGAEHGDDAPKPSAASGLPVTPEIIEGMLRAIPPSCDRNKWLTVCGGLTNAPVADPDFDGLALFTQWSRGDLHDGATPSNFTGEDDCGNEWERDEHKRANGEAVPAFGALVILAREHGYDGPSQTFSAAETFAKFAEAPEEKDAKGRRNHFSTRDEDRSLPPPQWLISDLIEDDTDVALVAPSKFLKSFLATELACSIATKRPVFGRLAVARQASVFYCAAEGAQSLKKRRITAWEMARGLDPYSARRVHVASATPMLSSTDAAEFVEDARAHMQPGDRSGLFIIDTMNRALNGADEDKSSTASAYFNLLAPIRRALGGSTLTVHHMGKNLDKGARGSSAFYAGFDTVIVIDKAVKDETSGDYFLTVRVDKQKDGEDGQEFHLRAQTVLTPDGPSLVLEPASEDEAKRAAGKQVGLRRTELGAALRKFGACPGGSNAWDGKRGGTTTRVLAELIARDRATTEEGVRGITDKEINVLVAALNKGARGGGPFEAYVVSAHSGGRQWAIVDGTLEEEIPHA